MASQRLVLVPEPESLAVTVPHTAVPLSPQLENASVKGDLATSSGPSDGQNTILENPFLNNSDNKAPYIEPSDRGTHDESDNVKAPMAMTAESVSDGDAPEDQSNMTPTGDRRDSMHLRRFIEKGDDFLRAMKEHTALEPEPVFEDENLDLKDQIRRLDARIRMFERRFRSVMTNEDIKEIEGEWDEVYQVMGREEHIKDHGVMLKNRSSRRKSEINSFMDHRQWVNRMAEEFYARFGADEDLDMKLKWAQERWMRGVGQRTTERAPHSSHSIEKFPLAFARKREAPITIMVDIPQLNRTSWAEFQRFVDVGYVGVLSPQRYAIDVLDGEPNITFTIPTWLGYRMRRHYPPIHSAAPKVLSASERTTGGKDLPPGQAPLPERIRINSRPLLRILSKIQGVTLSYDEKPVLIFRPFRSLIFYKDDIQMWKSRLEAKFAKPATVSMATHKSRGHKRSESGLDNSKTATVEDEYEEDNEDDKDDESVKSADSSDDIENDIYINTRAALDDLSCLIQFINQDLGDKLAYLNSNKCQTVTFGDIWYLFAPGDSVVNQEERQAYRVVNVTSGKYRVKRPRDWLAIVGDNAKAKLEDSTITISCVYIDFDGKDIGPVSENFMIPRFEGEKNVNALPVFPFRFAKTSNLKETLIKRGDTFLTVAGVQPMHYSGLTLNTREEVDSQVVIDFEEALSIDRGLGPKPKIEHVISTARGDRDVRVAQSSDDEDKGCIPECCATEIVHDDAFVEKNRTDSFLREQLSWDDQEGRTPSLAIISRPLKAAMDDEGYIGDDEKLIMSYRAYGFILRSRKWEENNFDLLVLPKGHREVVESLVTQHFRDKASISGDTDQVDIVRGKGKGLIILLHGAPGVGKTTTAECVANYFHKPLFQITCGDLGSTAENVENRLETNFALANRWGCILLIDEADVFLESRKTENFDRNSLVAVFLRVLDYYAGILFLTTNRVGSFDEAFTSRIHISLYYPHLNLPSTLQVFKVNLDRIRARFAKRKGRGEAQLDMDEAIINGFVINYFNDNDVAAHWNGRQIRNACQTALALAEFEAQRYVNVSEDPTATNVEKKKMVTVKLTSKHFRIVAKAYLSFMKYLKEVQGVDAIQRAKDFKLRHDKWGLEVEAENPFASRQKAVAAQRSTQGSHQAQRRHIATPPASSARRGSRTAPRRGGGGRLRAEATVVATTTASETDFFEQDDPFAYGSGEYGTDMAAADMERDAAAFDEYEAGDDGVTEADGEGGDAYGDEDGAEQEEQNNYYGEGGEEVAGADYVDDPDADVDEYDNYSYPYEHQQPVAPRRPKQFRGAVPPPMTAPARGPRGGRGGRGDSLGRGRGRSGGPAAGRWRR
ncbi:hypothetical protein G7Z17_g13 [Cylindrodendrum hubeiense]|uniref:AAA+ ATPase domain-containing protein n=1 Tax=Cylindrodendrum hubeiense TaxID=595255 RepID=A0A9P5LMQ4_9HYPO|nr:hypothetical protein G7Z17_g13 [Cylindrodendrum hubeiense]